jgi:DNA-binding NtrC family response regulator
MAPHVLVVDDERLMRWAVVQTLGAKGYDIAEACDAKSAMKAVAAPDATDLVLLDLCLPDSDDLRVLSFIRTHSPNTPVILMTAFGTREVLDEAAAKGAIVMRKPFDMTELASVVDRAIGDGPRKAVARVY